jgi:hypothetical protein
MEENDRKPGGSKSENQSRRVFLSDTTNRGSIQASSAIRSRVVPVQVMPPCRHIGRAVPTRRRARSAPMVVRSSHRNIAVTAMPKFTDLGDGVVEERNSLLLDSEIQVEPTHRSMIPAPIMEW